MAPTLNPIVESYNFIGAALRFVDEVEYLEDDLCVFLAVLVAL